jgi:hypothetical protein
MAVSQYFNNYNALNEQRVIEDLIVESIKIMGFDAYYLPNENEGARDLLYGEDPLRKFTAAFPLEFYLSDHLDYLGQQEFFGKFGLEIKDVVNVIVSKRSFQQRVPQNKITLTRPRENDLIYVPFLNGTGELYEITFVEQAKDFHMLGRKQPYFYELRMEKFKYSQEIIASGVAEIDDVVYESAYQVHLNLGAVNGKYEINEIVFQSDDSTYANATSIGTVQSWIPSSNTLSLSNIAGEFINGQLIIGQTSNAYGSLIDFDPLKDPSYRENYDNRYIANSAISVIDFSETNPFGSI